MLKINNLSIYTNNNRCLLKDFSFVLNDGDKIALIGEEGNGKSTLLKIIANIDVSEYVNYDGEIITNQLIGYLPQTIDTDKLNETVTDYIGKEIDYNELYSLIGELRIDDSLIHDRTLKDLSGGERVKIALLKVLYYKPDILLLDEPTNDLDLDTLIWLEDYIINSRLSIIFISHDEVLLQNCAAGILHLEQLKRKTTPKISYSGTSYDDYVKARFAYIERNNMLANKEKAQYNKQLEKWRRVYQKVHHDLNTVSRGDPHTAQLLKKKMHSVKAQGRRLEEIGNNLREKYEPEEAINIFFSDIKINPDKEIIDIKNLDLSIDNHLICQNINLKVLGKDKICIIGKNGSGKSTLIKYIYSQLKDRQDIKLGYVSQNYGEIIDYNKTPVHYLWDGINIERKKQILNMLGSLKFTADEINHSISELSEGQKCKVLILKLIVDECNVLLLDEPTRNLSPLSNPTLRKILIDYKGCIISVSHDRKYIDEVADKIYQLNKDGLELLF